MTETAIPVMPSIGEWSEPTDPDLKWISLASWCYCQVYKAHEQSGFKARVLEQVDIDTMLATANANIATMLTDIDSAYSGGNGDN